jgi:hypothetical protein
VLEDDLRHRRLRPGELLDRRSDRLIVSIAAAIASSSSTSRKDDVQ